MRGALALLIVLSTVPVRAAEPPLPEGAVFRFGATAFRTSGSALCLSPDSARAALRVPDGIDVLNLETGELVARLRDQKRLPNVLIGRECFRLQFAFTDGGKQIASSADEDGVHLWDAATGKFLRTIPGPLRADVQNNRKVPAAVKTVFNCQLADFVVAETAAGWHKLDTKTATWSPIAGSYDHISAVSPNGRWVTDYTDMASVENYVGVTDTALNKSAFTTASGGSYPFNSTPSPDGTFVACTTEEAGPQVWNITTGKEIKLAGVTPKTNYVGPAFTPDGKVLLVLVLPSRVGALSPARFARWDVVTGKPLADLAVPADLNAWAVDHKNNRLVVVAGQCVFRYDLVTGRRTDPPGGFIGYTRPALAPDAKTVAIGDAAGTLGVWEAPFTGRPRRLRDSGAAVHDLVFSSNGKTLFAGFADRSAAVFDFATGGETLLPAPRGKADDLEPWRTVQIAASPDGRTLVAEVDRERLWAWDVASGRVLWEVPDAAPARHCTGCRPVFAPDGSALYYGQPKAEVVKLDPRTGKELARLAVPVRLKSAVTRLAVSPDGNRLAAHTYYNDGELVLFEIGKGEALWRRTFNLDNALGALAFVPDGSALVSTHADGTVRGRKAADGTEALVRRGPAGYLWRLQLAADGRFALTDAPGATALLWKLK